jgi:CBS domain-containing protein
LAGIAAIVSEIVALPVSGVGLLESITVTPNVNVPDVLGAMLETWPATALLPVVAVGSSVKPVGRVPLVTANE